MVDKLIIAPGTDSDQFYATKLQLHTFITLVRGEKKQKKIIAAGGFEYPQAKAVHRDAVRLETFGKNLKESVPAFCKKYNVKNPLMPASTAAEFYALVPGAKLTHELFPERAVKRKDEIKKIAQAQDATEYAITAVRDVLARATIRKGIAYYQGKVLTSEILKSVAAVELARQDCSCSEMIISSGKQSALPHHRGAGPIKEGPVVVDIFPQSNVTRYFADCTRTFVVGAVPKTFDARYEAILAVHKEARKEIRHGASDIESVAKAVFVEHGFETDYAAGTGYIHSLGHGVGLEIHEAPRLNGKLTAGNVITIEPGLYYDYGIRVEDIGVVTKTGFKKITKLDKNPEP